VVDPVSYKQGQPPFGTLKETGSIWTPSTRRPCTGVGGIGHRVERFDNYMKAKHELYKISATHNPTKTTKATLSIIHLHIGVRGA
jgi:hypothetical protein